MNEYESEKYLAKWLGCCSNENAIIDFLRGKKKKYIEL